MTALSCDSTGGCDANALCRNVCAVRAATETTCAVPAEVEVRVAGDNAIYPVLKKYAGAFAAVALEARLLSQESSRVDNVRLADYAALGATQDVVRTCVADSSPLVLDARTRLATVINAVAAVRNGSSF